MKRFLPIVLLMVSVCIPLVSADKNLPAPAVQPAGNSQKFVPAQRLAILNVERIMAECEQAKEISTELQAEFMKRQEDFGKRAQALQEQQTKIKPGDEAAKKAYANKEAEFNMDVRSLQTDIERRSAEAQQKIVSALEKASEVVAKELSIDAYQPKFLYAKESADVTDRVIVEMNRAYRAEKQAAKFKEKSATAQAAAPIEAKNAASTGVKAAAPAEKMSGAKAA